ncbi:MAG: PQQ-dependent sugar dehydrogenase [Rhizobiaceae bacterium]
MKIVLASAITIALMTCVQAETFPIKGTAGSILTATEITSFKRPWAMTFLPDGSLLVTTKRGKMFHVFADGTERKIKGMPDVDDGGQGGLGDVILHPNYAENKLIYISYVKEKNDRYGAVVARGRLKLKKSGKGKLTAFEVIWKQKPKLEGQGHFSHRLAFGPQGTRHEGKLFITSGDRQRRQPAQEMDTTLGKVIRINDDGSVPKDNPWADGSAGKKARKFWTIGHRNMLGLAFDQLGQLWATEMGPRHGDELNLIKRKRNYGWPLVSEGNHYNGKFIPNHDTRPEFTAPKAYWVPSIAPSGLIIYNGTTFPKWRGNAFIGGLVSRALVRVEINGTTATEVERFNWGKRVREVEQGPNGDIWVLEDKKGGRLLRLAK